MSYDYRETEEEIIIDKGIATREMWKEYPHGVEHVSYDELVKACELRPTVPLVLDTHHDHTQPLTDAATSVGVAHLAPCPDKRGLRTTWHFRKARLPAWLLEQLRARAPLPVSIYQFTHVEDREQRDLLFDHIAILSQDAPRCPIEQCGVGVYDSNMTDQERDDQGRFVKKDEAPGPAVTAVPEPVPAVQPENKEATAAPVEAAPEQPAPDTKDQEIAALKAQLEEEQAKVNAVREPLVAELVQRGYTAQELNPLSLTTLQKMLASARRAATEGLPGTVPAPSTDAPPTLAEARAKEQQRFQDALKKRTEELFGDC